MTVVLKSDAYRLIIGTAAFAGYRPFFHNCCMNKPYAEERQKTLSTHTRSHFSCSSACVTRFAGFLRLLAQPYHLPQPLSQNIFSNASFKHCLEREIEGMDGGKIIVISAA